MDNSKSVRDFNTNNNAPIASSLMDMHGLITASQILSSEIDLNQLLIKMMDLLKLNSGADKIVLLLKENENWSVHVLDGILTKNNSTLVKQIFDLENIKDELIPETIFNFLLKSKEELVIENAMFDERFAKDNLIQTNKIKSIACIPMMSHGELMGMVYLENRKLENVFNLGRMEFLKHLSTQFRISTKNALLYKNLNQKILELKEIEMKLRLVFENANETILVAQDDVVKYCNLQITELTGYSMSEVLSMNFSKFIHPHDLGLVLKEYQLRLSGEVPKNKYSIRIITKKGQEKFIIVSSKLINWDDRPATLIIISDITKLKKTELDLKISENRFRQLMEQSPMPLEVLSPDGKIIQINNAWKKLWQVSDAEAEETIDKYNMLEDPQIEKLGIKDEVKAAFNGKHIILPPIQYDNAQTVDYFDIEQVKQFTAPWIQCHLNPVKDTKGEIIYIINTYVDITDFKESEKESQRQRDVIARIDRTSIMGQLTGSIAHELNQPLTGILSNSQAAKLMLKNKCWDEAELKEILVEIISDTKRASDVIRNLRELYQNQKIDLYPIEINTIIKGVSKLLHSELVMKGIELTIKNTSFISKVKGNKVQIEQVLVNLIINGIQSMDIMEKGKRKLLVMTSSNAREVKVCVEDKGNGISPDIIDHIFKPLGTWKSDGTGMGLAISNKIIEAHGGRMFAKNITNGGAQVGFVIPLIKKKE